MTEERVRDNQLTPPEEAIRKLLAGVAEGQFRRDLEKQLEQCGTASERLLLLRVALDSRLPLTTQAPDGRVQGNADACLQALRAFPDYNPATIRLLGEGGMGLVYRAQVRPPGTRVVVLKFIRPVLRGTEAEKRFAKEANAMALLSHPHIVPFYGYRTNDGQNWLELEYEKGGTLRERLGGRSLLADEALEVLVQVCEGLEAAHLAGILHRDIKPENTLIVGEKGSRLQVKLADFGLARLYEPGAADRDEPELASAVGTFDYMAPEIQSGCSTVDATVDIYSAGVMLHELLTGVRPAAGRQRLEALKDNRVLHDLVLKAIQPDPKNRYQSAKEFQAALEEARSRLRIGNPPIIIEVLDEDFWRRIVEVCIDGATAGGLKLMEFYRNTLRVQKAESGHLLNPSTLADEAATLAIIRAMDSRLQALAADTEHMVHYLAEETETEYQRAKLRQQLPEDVGRRLKSPKQFYSRGDRTIRVIIDGLDGTVNFDRRIPMFCSAVAVLVGDEVRASALYDPVHHVVYYGILPGPVGQAERGGEAYIWEIAAGRRTSLRQYRDAGPVLGGEQAVSLHLTRSGPDEKRHQLLRYGPDQDGSVWEQVARKSAGTYEFNCGLLSLAYVAMRMLGAYVNNHAKLVDLAAGEVLVRAAGGIVTTFGDRPLTYDSEERGTILAATDREFHQQLMAILRPAAGEGRPRP